jgi:cobalt-zinc-cadmium efflux system outer membrane protein
MVSQEIVTAKKLQLSSGALYKEADQASLAVISERYKLFAAVRQDFFDLLTLQRRAEILDAVVKLAEASVDTSEKLLKGKQVARLDVVQLEVDLERYKAELAATQRRIPATYRRLAANVGVQDLPYQPVKGSLDAPLPDYELDQVREYVLEIHPDVRRAQIGVEANQIWLRRAQVEPIPNLRLQTGYVRQFENRTPGSPTGSHDWLAHAGIAVPLFNRNQGNIQAAQALIGESIQQVEQTRNDLAAQVADAYANYAASRTQAQRYRDRIIPKANESYQLALKAYQGGQFEYLRVLEAQRAMANTRLEYITVLGTMWQQASLLSGLMLEDEWPPTAGAPAMPSKPNEPKDLLPNQLRDGTEILPAPNPGQ